MSTKIPLSEINDLLGSDDVPGVVAVILQQSNMIRVNWAAGNPEVDEALNWIDSWLADTLAFALKYPDYSKMVATLETDPSACDSPESEELAALSELHLPADKRCELETAIRRAQSLIRTAFDGVRCSPHCHHFSDEIDLLDVALNEVQTAWNLSEEIRS